MKQQGFTLIELLIAMGILLFLLLIIPPKVNLTVTNYQERVFLKQFEQDLKLAQTAAQTTGKIGKVSVLGQPANTIECRFYGNQSLNHDVPFPKSIHFSGVVDFVFTGQQGTLRKFKTIVFEGKEYRYKYVFQLAGGRYYVETTKK